MSNFTTRKLTNDRVLVKGTDTFGSVGETVLNSTQWSSVLAHIAAHSAEADFDAAVEEFFAPLMEAQAKFESAQAGPVADPTTYVVLHEAEEGRTARNEDVIHLGHDSVVLRILESGNHDRLVWVDGGLEVLDASEVSGQEQAATEAAVELLKNQLGAEVIGTEGTEGDTTY